MLGSVLGLSAGGLGALAANQPVPPCSACGIQYAAPNLAIPLSAAAIVLAVVSLLSLTGVRVAFMVGAILSGIVLVVILASWGRFTTGDTVVAAMLSSAALAADILASRPSKGLSEKDSPLNLPVFG